MNFTPTLQSSITDLIHDTRWSRIELTEEVAKRAQPLAKIAQGAHANFIIAHGNTPSFFADLIAVWQVGGCAVCVNPGLTESELKNVTEFVDARAILVATESSVSGSYGAPVLCTSDETGNAKQNSNPQPSCLDDPALILFTSGTTGVPKGVVHTHRSIQARIALNIAYIGRDTLARSLCILPTHFGHGLIGNCLTPLFSGGEVFLLHNAGMQRYQQLADILAVNDVTFMSSVPTFWKLILRIAEQPESTPLKRVQIGSAPLAAEVWRDVINWTGTQDVVNAYGITETANWIGGASAAQFEPESGLVGTPWGGQFAVLDEHGNVNANGEGEVVLRVPSLMSGYYLQPELTSEVLRAGWYLTGDIGHIDAAGVLRMTGRNRFAINRAGMKIYPEELDLLLETHPAVEDACAFALPDELSYEAVAIALRVRENVDVSDQDIISWIRQRIRAEAVPQHIFRVDEIPKTDRGKINRDKVAAYCLALRENKEPRGTS